MIFGQEDIDGRLLVLGEIVAHGYGTTRFVSEKIRPYLRREFPLLNVEENFFVAPDPAAANRAQNDEKTAVEILKRYFNVSVETNNRLPLRLDAIEYFATRLIDGKPALQIDGEKCPMLVRALKGGWRYSLDKAEQVKSDVPEKNPYSHPGDGFGYLARFFHRQALRNERYSAAAARPAQQRMSINRGYHAR